MRDALGSLDGDAVAAAIVDGGPLPTLVLDPDGVIARVNRAACELFGQQASALLGQHAAILIADDDLTEVESRILEAATRTRRHLEVEVRTASGTVPIGFSVAPLQMDGVGRGLVLVGRDVSERRAVERELAELAASTRALSSSSEIGMYRFGFEPQMHLAEANPAFAEILGYPVEVLLDTPSPLWTNVPDDVEERFRRNRFGAAPDWPIEWDWTRPDGTVRTISVTEVPLRSRDGRVSSTLGICRDVTAERTAHRLTQQALAREREAIAQLRRVDDLRRLFLQAVSHELRTPLTAVAGFAATLHQRLDELAPEQVRDLSARLDRQAGRLRELLDDLMDIERVGRGVAHVNRSAVDLEELVARVAGEHAPAASLDTVPVSAQLDRVKVERIVVNLLANARRHAGADARITVTVRPDGDAVVITVDDDGPGIDAGSRERIFEPFEQGESAADALSPGTGIGLTLVAEFTRLHGGSVELSDAPIGGARFEVRLPIEPDTSTEQGAGP